MLCGADLLVGKSHFVVVTGSCIRSNAAFVIATNVYLFI